MPWVWKLSTVFSPQACPLERSACVQRIGVQSGASISTALMEYVQAEEQAAEHGVPAVAAECSGRGSQAGAPEPQQVAGRQGLSAAQVFGAMHGITRRLEGWPAQLWDAAGWSPPAGAAPAAPASCEQQHSLWVAPKPAAATAEHVTAQQDAAAVASSDVPPGAFLTPQLMVEAYNRAGVCCVVLQMAVS